VNRREWNRRTRRNKKSRIEKRREGELELAA
jgi:hypothetical protein